MEAGGPEIRVGMVLYGGVSLAVYMYGVVVEVQRLLAAAEELRGGADPDDLSPYARALHEAGASGVSVDLLSGTSAGGINGVLLAKALARGGDVGAARDLWIEGGDIEQLLQPPSRLDPRSLLQSKYFETQIGKGMRLLDKPGEGAPPVPGILDLFVSSTSIGGGERLFVDALGSSIESRQHRYVFQLKLRSKRPGPGEEPEQGYDHDDFEATKEKNDRLVKLCRATSAFPFAFEPVKIGDGDELLEAGDADAWFADGGILNNKPFTEAVETIVNRSSDRPVRRWLFSIDPDPKPTADEEAGETPPAFDSVVVRAIATIPRYQSIVRDLLALQEHNDKVAAAETAIYEGEQELAAATEAGRLGAGLAAATEAMRRQAWGLEVADRLLAGTAVEGGGPLDTAGVHRVFRFIAEAQYPIWWAATDDTDPARHRRRLYYLIKLIGMAQDSPALRAAKAALWAEYEEVSRAMWEAFSEPGLRLSAASQLADAERLGEGRLAGTIRGLATAVTASAERLAGALEGVVAEIAPVAPTHPVTGAAGPSPEPVSVRLDRAFEQFDPRDAMLLAADVYGGLRQRDRIAHAQISPATATNTEVSAHGRLAGATLGHFGGFLDRGWRANDLMWGRLDGAEVLMRAVLKDAPEAPDDLLDRAQEEVLEDERRDLLDGDWKANLAADTAGDRSAGELNGKRLLSLSLRAAGIVRRMLRTAAADSTDGKGALPQARAWVLRAVANVIGFGLALLYLPATALFAKGRVVLRVLIVLTLLPTLWGVATLVLGIIGVLDFSDVVGPSLVGIAVYPLFVLGYWLLGRVARRLDRIFGGDGG